MDLHRQGTGIAAGVATAIRLVGLDVDGVLTDGGIYLGASGSGEPIEMKRFEITDGLGIRLLQEAGLQVAIITGRVSHAVRIRAEELGISECHQDSSAAKLPLMEALLGRLGLTWNEAAFVGDDLPDLPLLRRVALPAAVASAAREVRAEARWVARRRGGQGAVREFAEALLRARGEWHVRVERYVAGREANA
jgi:3-deoxy-D-manno-octulosonate 8-phosphate phosphatase (KDO 8-P phosphatase)